MSVSVSPCAANGLGGWPRVRLAPIPLHRRLLAGALAAAISALLIAGLERGPVEDRQPYAVLPPPVTIYLPPLRTEPRAASRPAEPSRRSRPTLERLLRSSAEPINRPERPRPEAITVPTPSSAQTPAAPALPSMPQLTPPAAAAAAASAPSQPLRLDSELLRSAAVGSRSSVSSVARAAGHDLDRSADPGADARWSRSVGSAARADCLAADEKASLLSAVSIAARALAGRCP